MVPTNSADLILNPVNGSTPVYLMLAREQSSGRAWRREYQPTKEAPARVAGSLEWTDFSGGDGYGWIETPPGGKMPPFTAEGNLDCRWPGMIRLPPKLIPQSGPTRAIRLFTHANYVWAIEEAGGTNPQRHVLWRIDPLTFTTTSYTDSILAVDSGFFGDVVVFDGAAYLGKSGAFGGAWKIDSIGTMPPTEYNAWRWRRGTVTRDKFFFAGGANGFRSVTTGLDPTVAGNWSADLGGGDTSGSFTALVGINRLLYIGRSDGLKALDTEAQLVDLMPDLKSYVSTENCLYAVDWHGAVVVPHIRGLFLHSEGLTTPIGLDQTRRNQTNLYGKVLGMVQDGEWLWVLLQAPPRTAGGNARGVLLAARERTRHDPGFGPLVWYQLHEWEGNTNGVVGGPMAVENYVTNIYGQGAQLWLSKHGTVARMVLPTRGMPPTKNLSGDTYALTGEKVFPTVDFGTALLDHTLTSMEIDLAVGGGTGIVTVYYALDPDDVNPTWTELGPVGFIGAGSGRQTLSFGPGVTCRRFKFKLVMTTSDENYTPAVYRVAVNYLDRPDTTPVHAYVCRVGRHVEDRNGARLYANPEDTLATLKAFQESNQPMSFIGPTGKVGTATLIGMNVVEAEDLDHGQEPVYRVELLLREM